MPGAHGVSWFHQILLCQESSLLLATSKTMFLFTRNDYKCIIEVELGTCQKNLGINPLIKLNKNQDKMQVGNVVFYVKFENQIFK